MICRTCSADPNCELSSTASHLSEMRNTDNVIFDFRISSMNLAIRHRRTTYPNRIALFPSLGESVALDRNYSALRREWCALAIDWSSAPFRTKLGHWYAYIQKRGSFNCKPSITAISELCGFFSCTCCARQPYFLLPSFPIIQTSNLSDFSLCRCSA